MRKPIVILLIVELVTAIILGQVGHVYRRDFARAFVTWYKDRSPENQMELDRQKRLTQLSRWEFSGVMFGCMAAVTFLCVGLHRHHKDKQA